MLYFAYGSNMSRQRIARRLSNSDLIGVAVLSHFQIRFHKKGQDGSAKADAMYTDDPNDNVFGALYHLGSDELSLLDRIEGCGVGYERKEVVVDCAGERMTAWIYCAVHIDRSLKPFDWYLRHVVTGAEQLGLPVEYIDHLKSIKSCIDEDLKRVAKENSIY